MSALTASLTSHVTSFIPPGFPLREVHTQKTELLGVGAIRVIISVRVRLDQSDLPALGVYRGSSRLQTYFSLPSAGEQLLKDTAGHQPLEA